MKKIKLFLILNLSFLFLGSAHLSACENGDLNESLPSDKTLSYKRKQRQNNNNEENKARKKKKVTNKPTIELTREELEVAGLLLEIKVNHSKQKTKTSPQSVPDNFKYCPDSCYQELKEYFADSMPSFINRDPALQKLWNHQSAADMTFEYIFEMIGESAWSAAQKLKRQYELTEKVSEVKRFFMLITEDLATIKK